MLRPISYSLCLLGSLAWFVPSISHAQEGGFQLVGFRTCQNDCGNCAQGCSPGDGSEGMADTSMGDTGMTDAANNAMASNQADSFGSASGPSSGVPGMLGDSYIAGAVVTYTDTVNNSSYRSIIPYGGRYKCADNTGPVPTNRVSFAYKHFQNALQSNIVDTNGSTFSNGSVDSYTLGIEKTFLQQRASLEIRVPFYAGSVFSSDVTGGQQSSMSAPEFGNLSFIFKTLFYRGQSLAVGGGLGIDIPTADDTEGRALDLQNVFYSSKETYLAPFLAFLAVPNDTWWVQGVVQFSFVTGSNELFSPTEGGAGGGGSVDTLLLFQEQDMVFTTVNVGRWLYKNPNRNYLLGVAAIAELNWTATLDHTQTSTFDDGSGLNVTVSNIANEQHIFNLTLGTHLQVTDKSNLRVSAVVPLRENDNVDNTNRNRYFDSEISVQFNRQF